MLHGLASLRFKSPETQGCSLEMGPDLIGLMDCMPAASGPCIQQVEDAGDGCPLLAIGTGDP